MTLTHEQMRATIDGRIEEHLQALLRNMANMRDSLLTAITNLADPEVREAEIRWMADHSQGFVSSALAIDRELNRLRTLVMLPDW